MDGDGMPCFDDWKSMLESDFDGIPGCVFMFKETFP